MGFEEDSQKVLIGFLSFSLVEEEKPFSKNNEGWFRRDQPQRLISSFEFQFMSKRSLEECLQCKIRISNKGNKNK